MPWPKFSLGLLVGTALFASAQAGHHERADKKPTNDNRAARSTFERLKQLAGDWVPASPGGGAGEVVERYRVTSGGNAVVVTHFPGTDHEMVTVYCREGDRVVLTHYCHLGNQPRMRSEAGTDGNEVVFEFAGGGNLNPAKDVHMHGCRLRFVDADHLHGEWELFKDGKSSAKHAFDLVRKK